MTVSKRWPWRYARSSELHRASEALAAAVLALAIRDAEGDTEHTAEAREWIFRDYEGNGSFDFWCELAGRHGPTCRDRLRERVSPSALRRRA